MPRKPDPTLKPAIIEKVALHLRDTKIEDVSVRSLGRVLGTSAYPVVYHFGSRDALIDAVVEHLAGTATTAALDPGADPAVLVSYIVAVFGGLDDPERALAARLTFERGSVESLDGRDRERALHCDHVAAIAAWCEAHGVDPAIADRAARDAVLSARGAQWGAIVDAERSALDTELRTIASTLTAVADASAARGAAAV
jgi:AcrR family transcriptional regulator